MRTLKTLLVLVLGGSAAAALVVFANQNAQSTHLRFAVWEAPELPLAYALLLTFFLGFFLAFLVWMVEFFRVKGRLRKSTKMIELLEREIDALRNQPLYEDTGSRKVKKEKKEEDPQATQVEQEVRP